MVQPLLIDELSALPGIAHGFFTRRGGVSQGLYASLNCGVGASDAAEAVRENRARVAGHLGSDRLVTPHQVHGTAVAVVDRGSAPDWRPKVDALVTAMPGVALGVLTADCAPILLADAQARVVGAAHAGWRGALAGVAEAVLRAMEGLGAARQRIHAAVGPCIGAGAYEVGPEFEVEFLGQDADNARFFARPHERARPSFDLSGYVAHRLRQAGVALVTATGTCSFSAEREFFSYRRSLRRAEPDYGRQVSAIVLT